MQPYTQSQQEFLGSLLSVIIMKMKYDEESDWGNDEDEPEEEALFMEMRKVSDQENYTCIDCLIGCYIELAYLC